MTATKIDFKEELLDAAKTHDLIVQEVESRTFSGFRIYNDDRFGDGRYINVEYREKEENPWYFRGDGGGMSSAESLMFSANSLLDVELNFDKPIFDFGEAKGLTVDFKCIKMHYTGKVAFSQYNIKDKRGLEVVVHYDPCIDEYRSHEDKPWLVTLDGRERRYKRMGSLIKNIGEELDRQLEKWENEKAEKEATERFLQIVNKNMTYYYRTWYEDADSCYMAVYNKKRSEVSLEIGADEKEIDKVKGLEEVIEEVNVSTNKEAGFVSCSIYEISPKELSFTKVQQIVEAIIS
jgi:hypothetical protein